MNRFDILRGKASPLLCEKWVCYGCEVPCRVEIEYERTEFEAEKINQRFRFHNVCICGKDNIPESRFPDWVPHEPL